jgi:hypothetical protein
VARARTKPASAAGRRARRGGAALRRAGSERAKRGRRTRRGSQAGVEVGTCAGIDHSRSPQSSKIGRCLGQAVPPTTNTLTGCSGLPSPLLLLASLAP